MARKRIDVPDRFDPGNGRPHQLGLEFITPIMGIGVEPASVSRGEGQERDLVDRGVDRDGITGVGDEARRGRAVAGEAGDECR